MHPTPTASKLLTHQLANAGPWSLPVLPCISSGSRTRSPKELGVLPLDPRYRPISKNKQQITYLEVSSSFLGLRALAGIRNSRMHLVCLCLQSLASYSKAILESSQKPFWKIFLDKSGHEMTILISLVKSKRNASRVG